MRGSVWPAAQTTGRRNGERTQPGPRWMVSVGEAAMREAASLLLNEDWRVWKPWYGCGPAVPQTR